MDAEEMKRRTRSYALRVVRLTEALPSGRTADVLGKQLLRAGTAVGANYRSACRAKSRADFVSKMTVVEEEADEALYWMELLIEGGVVRADRMALLKKEGEEILAIVVASITTARKGKRARGG